MLLSGPGIETSISAYYYTIMRDVFVASLCAIGVFLMSYRGYQKIDEIAGKLACVFAVGTALLPTSPVMNATPVQSLVGTFHVTMAGLLFLSLAFFSLFLFRKTDPTKPPTFQKKVRNTIYAICGVGILACIVLITALNFFPKDSSIFALSPVFWLESLAILFFGLSWFVKGEAILKDQN